jgi:hypothetical protein
VEYRSVEELKMAIREVQNALLIQGADGDAPRKSRQVRVTTSEGFSRAVHT